MKERPILFSAPMVRALLAGTKTQTRRIAPIRRLDIVQHPSDMVTWAVSFLKATKGVLSSHSGGKLSDLQARSIIASQFNPYGPPGDRLWVRETFGHFERNDTLRPGARIYFRADGECLELEPWRPSIHMPRWASRITLEVTDVRVERLQDISEADAVAEGVSAKHTTDAHYTAREAYAALWEQINGGGSWDANPWVWCVSFRRIKP